MPDYKIPKYAGSWDNFNADDFEHSITIVTQSNRAEYELCLELHKELIKDTEILYGKNSKQVKYIRKAVPAKPPNLFRKILKPTMNKFRAWEEKQIEKDKRRDYSARRAAAQELLSQFGFEPDVHYRATRAITFANKVLSKTPDGNYVIALPSGDEL